MNMDSIAVSHAVPRTIQVLHAVQPLPHSTEQTVRFVALSAVACVAIHAVAKYVVQPLLARQSLDKGC